MVAWWWVIPGFVAVIGLAIALSGLGWMFRGRPFKGGRGVAGGGLVLATAAAVGLMGLNIQSYHRLGVDRQCVAVIQFTSVSENVYSMAFQEPQDQAADCRQATLSEARVLPRAEQMAGDEWLMRARVIRWKPWATVLGLDAQYRLESIDGTWGDQDTRRSSLPTVVDLRPARRTGLDFMPFAQFLSQYAPILEAGPTAGEAAYWPMAHNARFNIYLTAQGDLRVEAANPEAVDAVSEWVAGGPQVRDQQQAPAQPQR